MKYIVTIGDKIINLFGYNNIGYWMSLLCEISTNVLANNNKHFNIIVGCIALYYVNIIIIKW